MVISKKNRLSNKKIFQEAPITSVNGQKKNRLWKTIVKKGKHPVYQTFSKCYKEKFKLGIKINEDWLFFFFRTLVFTDEYQTPWDDPNN